MTGFDVKLLVQTGDSPQINFGYGGHQEARGWSVTPQSSFYVENVLEELDSEGEWFFEEDKFLLYVCAWHPHDSLGCVVRCEYIDGACRLCWADPNATAGQSIDSIDISLPLLNTLISIASNRSTPQADRVHDVSFVGFELSQVQFAIV